MLTSSEAAKMFHLNVKAVRKIHTKCQLLQK